MRLQICRLLSKKNDHLASASPSIIKLLETRLQIVMLIRDALAILQIHSKLVIFLQYQFTTLPAHLQEETRVLRDAQAKFVEILGDSRNLQYVLDFTASKT